MMLDSILVYIGEVFLDTVIDKSQNTKISKKTRIICTILFMLITLFYMALFIVVSYIAISSWNFDKLLAIKMFIVSFILLIVFTVYGHKVIVKRKKNF